MKISPKIYSSLLALLLAPFYHAEESNGLAPEVTDFNAKDASHTLEKQIPYLRESYITANPQDRKDGISIGKFENKKQQNAILKLAREFADDKHDVYDSFLIAHKNQLIFESYYKRGRVDFPHYQMSITKSYTALALGRAIQLGYINMEALQKPFHTFLKDLDPSKFVAGADKITLHEAMHMRSGIRIDKDKVKQVMKNVGQLKGQGQVQAYLENSQPITPGKQVYKYQGSDPSITMQVLEAVVPGSAKDFIKNELLDKLGIETFGWQEDISGLPKAAAGSSMKSRDMLKWGMLVMNKGKWQGEQLIPAEFIKLATSKINTNKAGTSYGYFWWRHNMDVNGKKVDCKSGRGAGGQFILMFEELDLLVVVTSHNKGMGKTLRLPPERILPLFMK
ncbi:MAG: serine hydrolase [Lentisphaerales bacterium]|nr:serine hydrolase [Lentisphaerales bacterium]